MTAAGARRGGGAEEAPPPRRVTASQARRILLRSQGIGARRRDDMADARASRRALERTLARTRLLQIDSVSVFARAHHMPVFSRTGPWDPRSLDAAVRPSRGRLVRESFAHEAAYATEEVHRLLAFKRARIAERDWGAIRRAGRMDAAVLERIERTIAAHAPIDAAGVARILGDGERPADGWGWRRTDTQWAVEYLFRAGRLDCVGRSPQFARLYRPSPQPEEPPSEEETEASVTALVALAAESLGIAGADALADYFRLRRTEVDRAIGRLTTAGLLRPVVLSDVPGPVLHLWHAAPSAAPVAGECLLSPFDPVVFHRPSLARLFGVEYRIGIYTPEHLRTHGYYALPFLLGDRIEARADLRAARARGVLEVRECHRERGAVPGRGRAAVGDDAVASALARELRRAAVFQGLETVEVAPVGDLAPALAHAVAEGGPAPVVHRPGDAEVGPGVTA